MNKLAAVLVLGAVLFAAIPAAAFEARVEGQHVDQRVQWPLEPNYDVLYPEPILILDLPDEIGDK